MTAGIGQLYRDKAQPWVVPAPTGTGKTIYVSNSGSDSNSGASLGAAKATLHGADLIATPGSVIRVQPGSYQVGSATASNILTSGTSQNRISYWSEKLHQAKIVGGLASSTNVTGIWIQGGFVDFMGFEVDGTAATGSAVWSIGFYTSGTNISIQYCLVHDILRNSTDYTTYTNNSQGGAGIDCDNFSGAVDVMINGNVIYNIGTDASDSSVIHGMYMISSGTYQNNLLYNCVDGITSYHAFTSAHVLNNTIADCRHGGITIHSSAADGNHCRVFNNIVANITGASAFSIGEGGTVGTDNIYTNNICFNAGTPLTITGGGSQSGTLTTDPQFANSAARNYHLKHSSPGYRAGTSNNPSSATNLAGAATVDLRGFARSGTYDRGVYQE